MVVKTWKSGRNSVEYGTVFPFPYRAGKLNGKFFRNKPEAVNCFLRSAFFGGKCWCEGHTYVNEMDSGVGLLAEHGQLHAHGQAVLVP